MKMLERTTLVLFSTLMLITSVIFCLLVFGWLDIDFIADIFKMILNDPASSKIFLGLSIVFILLGIRGIFFDSNAKEKIEYGSGILLQNSDGKLLITKETVENLVRNVVKGFDSAEDVTTKIELDKENNVKVFVNLNVKENAIIKELSTNLQAKIKETIKQTADLEVKEVNIKIKNVEPVKNIVQE